ncbi:MAG: TIM barrel protein [Candidatus Bathyarchaeia archaeon]|nr:TIM barrel protein [Candidatus Bathyarchaeota archaeon]
MRIFLGPAGIPTAAGERSTTGGLLTLSQLGLNAMEIEFVRSIYLTRGNAEAVGELAGQLGIQLTVHAPYFINLLSEKRETAEASKKRILESLDRAEAMNAEAVVVHPAYYGGLGREEAFKEMEGITRELLDGAESLGGRVKLAYETMAKESQFAGLEELLRLVETVKSDRLTVCVDFAHIFVRNKGRISYPEVLDKLKGLGHVYSHFSNMRYNPKTRRFMDVHEPIDGYPPFKPLAEEILRRKMDITIISESPILEVDSLKMKGILKELGYEP